MSRIPLLQVTQLSKRFPGVVALEKVSLSVKKGEFVAVVGENGAGKSTLMKILAGIQDPDEGEILFEGAKVAMSSVQKAQSLGIALIHQELNLADNLDVAGNVFLGREPRKGFFLKRQVMRERTEEILQRLGTDFGADAPVSRLSLGQRQLVEIAKALSLDARLIIMDEPTSSLSGRETEALFTVIAGLREQGMTILYISHRLGEVKRLADRVVALRDGQLAGELAKNEITHEAMVRLMVGRDLSRAFAHEPAPPEAVALEVQQLRTRAYPAHSLDFTVRRGEIVGLAGLVGAGRTEVLRALFGVERPLSGKVVVNNKAFRPRNPRRAIKRGLALVPEDRKALGLFLPESVAWNMTIPQLSRNSRFGIFLDDEAALNKTGGLCQRMKLKSAGYLTAVGTLSGGNQQKVVLGKWIGTAPRVLLLDEPTRGIDVGAKREIYQLMEVLAREGVAILFASSEMEEILAMSDRVLVMNEGRITGELARHELSEEAVMKLATAAPIPPAVSPARVPVPESGAVVAPEVSVTPKVTAAEVDREPAPAQALTSPETVAPVAMAPPVPVPPPPAPLVPGPVPAIASVAAVPVVLADPNNDEEPVAVAVVMETPEAPMKKAEPSSVPPPPPKAAAPVPKPVAPPVPPPIPRVALAAPTPPKPKLPPAPVVPPSTPPGRVPVIKRTSPSSPPGKGGWPYQPRLLRPRPESPPPEQS